MKAHRTESTKRSRTKSRAPSVATTPPAPPTPSEEWLAYRASRALYVFPGPWDTEPDRDLWTTAANLPGAIIRHPDSGHLCGYVAVPRGHDAHGVSMSRIQYARGPIPKRIVEAGAFVRDVSFARGGVDPLNAGNTKAKDPDWWWLGFACSHVGDATPSDPWVKPQNVYRGWDDVLTKVERFAAALAKL